MHRKEPSPEIIRRLNYISLFLKNIRINDGLSQQDVSDQCNLHRNSIHRVENAQNITVLTLLELCEAYNLPLAEMFMEIE